jgi:hypothetical protein
MGLGGEHWQSRFKAEEILEVGCPKCGAKPHQWCDRAADKLSKRGQELRKAGTPPSHTERMWIRQGHAEHEFPALLARQRPGWDESAPKPGKPARRPGAPAARSGCTPCAAERKFREWLRSPLFPPDFPCRHPRSDEVPAPGYPRRYAAERVCPQCVAALCAVEVVVQDPATAGYRCGRCGHMWLATV